METQKVVQSIDVYAGVGIDRIEFKYTNGTSWFCGGLGGKFQAGLKLDVDEWITVVALEELPQRLYVGSGVKITTNKGRVLETWTRSATKDVSQITEMGVSSGRAAVGLRVVNGVLKGFIEDTPPTPAAQDGRVALHWLYFSVPSSEDGTVVATPAVHRRGYHTAQEALEEASMLKNVLGWATVDVVQGVASKRAGDSAHCTARAMEDGILQWKGLRGDRKGSGGEGWDRLGVLWRMIELMEWNRYAHLLVLEYSMLLVRSLLDGMIPVLTGAVFNVIGSKADAADSDDMVFQKALRRIGGSKLGGVIVALVSTDRGLDELIQSMIIALLCIAALRAVTDSIHSFVASSVKERSLLSLRRKLVAHMLSQEMEWFDDKRVGEASQITQPQRLYEVVGSHVPNLVADSFKLVIFLSFLFTISPAMTLAFLLLLPTTVWLGRTVVERRAKKYQKLTKKHRVAANQTVNEASSMMPTVKAFSRESHHLNEFNDSVEHILDLALLKHRLQAAWLMCSGLIQQFTLCGCMWTAFVTLKDSSSVLSAGEMTSFLLLVNQIRGLGNAVQKHLKGISDNLFEIEEMFEFLQKEPTRESGKAVFTVTGHVEFEDVHFSYASRQNTPVLRGVTFTVHPGKLTAIVGPSGAGKSTIAHLILRLYDPSDGAIKFDGVDLKDIDLSHLHTQVAIVHQTPSLFNTSIRNNIAYGHPTLAPQHVPMEDIEAAAREACAHSFIESFPASYDTFVGDQGTQLSGGQRQRIAIARALIRKPKLLVLDEATSALDTLNEQAVLDGLSSAMQGHSDVALVVIAHRLSTVKQADEIICMDNGRVVERGTHSALLKQHGFYEKLVQRQLNDQIDE